eukprot:5288827-Karenia_brevis.AAC.1
MADEEVLAAAVACYGICRTVQCMRAAGEDVKHPGRILRLYLHEGMRGSKAKKVLRSVSRLGMAENVLILLGSVFMRFLLGVVQTVSSPAGGFGEESP